MQVNAYSCDDRCQVPAPPRYRPSTPKRLRFQPGGACRVACRPGFCGYAGDHLARPRAAGRDQGSARRTPGLCPPRPVPPHRPGIGAIGRSRARLGADDRPRRQLGRAQDAAWVGAPRRRCAGRSRAPRRRRDDLRRRHIVRRRPRFSECCGFGQPASERPELTRVDAQHCERRPAHHQCRRKHRPDRLVGEKGLHDRAHQDRDENLRHDYEHIE